MTEAAIVIQKLTTLREHLDRVRRRRPANVEALRAGIDIQDALALSLLVAIQEAVDIAFHIAADEGWGSLVVRRGLRRAQTSRRSRSA